MRPLFAKVSLSLLPLALAACLAACGGGGSGTSGGGSSVLPAGTGTATPKPTPVPTPTPTVTPTPAPIVLSGTAVEYTSGAALSGFAVTVGAVPVASTCLTGESNTSDACGVPGNPSYTGTTTASGTFSVTVPAAGTYMLTIANGATYATLHRSVTIPAAGLAIGTVKVAALSTDEQAWLADLNNQRATVSTPVSFSNLVIDEYAEEQARAEAAAVASGAQPYGDATESLYIGYYAASPGVIYSTAGGAADLVGAASGYLTADTQWMAEKANCPSGNWQTCTFAANTGHYINISTTANVWVGVGESSTSFSDPPYGNEWAYALILPGDNSGTAPASVARAAAVLQPTR